MTRLWLAFLSRQTWDAGLALVQSRSPASAGAALAALATEFFLSGDLKDWDAPLK